MVIQHKKHIPSLFESDSESEIDYFQVDASAKSNLYMHIMLYKLIFYSILFLALDEDKEKLFDAPEIKCTYSAFNTSNTNTCFI